MLCASVSGGRQALDPEGRAPLTPPASLRSDRHPPSSSSLTKFLTVWVAKELAPELIGGHGGVLRTSSFVYPKRNLGGGMKREMLFNFSNGSPLVSSFEKGDVFLWLLKLNEDQMEKEFQKTIEADIA